MDSEYTRVEVFETEVGSSIAAGSSGIAVTSGPSIELVTGIERCEIAHDESVVDVALSDRLLVLSEDELTAYSSDGDELWSRPIDAGHAVAALPGDDLVSVLSPDRLFGIDGGTGRERFVFDRTRSGSRTDDSLIATPGGFVIATWTFLTAVSAAGNLTFDRNLDAVVRSIGRFDDGIVAALQNGTTVCLDDGTGTVRWQADLSAKDVSPVGRSALLTRTSDGIRAIRAGGTIESTTQYTHGSVYMAADGSVGCSVRAGTASTYVRTADLPVIDVLTESVNAGTTIDVDVSNPADTTRDVTLEANVDGAVLSAPVQSVTLEPEETARVDFPVSSIHEEAQTELEISTDTVVAERTRLALEDASSERIAIETDLTATRIDDGMATLAITVENGGDSPIDSIRVLETDAGVDDLQPGAQWTETITRPYEHDRRISTGIEAVRDDHRREFAPTCTLPSLPELDLEVVDEAVRLDLRAKDSIPVSDSLVLDVPGAGHARLPVEIDETGLQLVIPTFDEGTTDIEFENIELERQVPATDPSQRDELAGMNRHRDRIVSHEDAQYTSDSSRDVTPVSVSRDLVNTPRPVGHVVRERVEIVNERAEPTEIRLAGGETTAVSLDGNDEVTLSRSLAVLSSPAVVPTTTIETAAGARKRLPETQLESESGLSVRMAVDPGEGAFVAELENGTESGCSARAVRVGEAQVPLDVRLEPDETTVITDRLDGWSPPPADVLEASVTVSTDTGDERTREILVAVTELPARTRTSERPFLERIGADTQVTGEYGTAVLVFENELDRPLDTVTITASGEPIDELFYSETYRDRVAPGERIEHFVDLSGTATDATFDVTIAYTDDGEEHRYTLRASGPVAQNEDTWCDDHLTAWSLEPIDRESDRALEAIPSLAATAYRLD